MKSCFFGLLCALALAALAPAPCGAQVTVTVTTSAPANFSELGQYGEWMHVHRYGDRVAPLCRPGMAAVHVRTLGLFVGRLAVGFR